MAGDPNVWKDLADRFRALDSQDGKLIFMWYANQGGSAEIHYGFGGTKVTQFGAIARRAAIALGNTDAETLIDAWIRQVARVFTENVETEALCAVSAEICSALEGEALERQYSEGIQRETPAQAPVQLRSPKKESRESRLQQFISTEKTTIAAVCRAARVNKKNMQQWRHDELSDASVMSERIECVLSGKTPVG
jgi:hypothetical protein